MFAVEREPRERREVIAEGWQCGIWYWVPAGIAHIGNRQGLEIAGSQHIIVFPTLLAMSAVGDMLRTPAPGKGKPDAVEDLDICVHAVAGLDIMAA